MAVQRYGEVKHLPIGTAMRQYLLASCSPVDPVVEDLVERTAEIGDLAIMMIPAEQAALLTMLTRMVNARTVRDVGTFTGLSALSFARGLPAGGRVISCDISDEWAAIATMHWQRAEVDDRIDFRLAPAESTLRGIDLVSGHAQ